MCKKCCLFAKTLTSHDCFRLHFFVVGWFLAVRNALQMRQLATRLGLFGQSVIHLVTKVAVTLFSFDVQVINQGCRHGSLIIHVVADDTHRRETLRARHGMAMLVQKNSARCARQQAL